MAKDGGKKEVAGEKRKRSADDETTDAPKAPKEVKVDVVGTPGDGEGRKRKKRRRRTGKAGGDGDAGDGASEGEE